MYATAISYMGTGDDAAIRRLPHVTISDVDDEMRGTAAMDLILMLSTTPDHCPELALLLINFYYFHVRYGAAMTPGIALAGTGYKDALVLTEPMKDDPINCMKQVALTSILDSNQKLKLEVPVDYFAKAPKVIPEIPPQPRPSPTPSRRVLEIPPVLRPSPILPPPLRQPPHIPPPPRPSLFTLANDASTEPEVTIRVSASAEAIRDSAFPKAIRDSASPEAIRDSASPEAIRDTYLNGDDCTYGPVHGLLEAGTTYSMIPKARPKTLGHLSIMSRIAICSFIVKIFDLTMGPCLVNDPSTVPEDDPGASTSVMASSDAPAVPEVDPGDSAFAEAISSTSIKDAPRDSASAEVKSNSSAVPEDVLREPASAEAISHSSTVPEDVPRDSASAEASSNSSTIAEVVPMDPASAQASSYSSIEVIVLFVHRSSAAYLGTVRWLISSS